MKTILPSFEEVISFQSLYRAHRKARLGKRHKKQVVEFELHLAQNLCELHYDLKYGKYEIGKYNRFMIYDPKEREIQSISYRDRIVQHVLCDNYLTPLLESKLIFDNTACRKNKGSHFALDRLSMFMRKFERNFSLEDAYFVKLDMAKYFPTINHTVLKEKLKKIVKDQRIFELCTQIIDSYNKEQDKGLPMGNQSSQCFALLYLNDFDHFMKEKMHVKFYVRYMDDIIMLVSGKKRAREILALSQTKISTQSISVNKKSQIISAKNGIVFLGWKIFLKNGKVIRKIKKQLKQRILFKIKSNSSPKNLAEKFASYNGTFSHGNAHDFFVIVQNMLDVLLFCTKFCFVYFLFCLLFVLFVQSSTRCKPIWKKIQKIQFSPEKLHKLPKFFYFDWKNSCNFGSFLVLYVC